MKREELAALLEAHQQIIDYGYEEQECSCGAWKDNGLSATTYAQHLLEVVEA